MNPGVEYMIASVLDFQTDGETPFWSSSLYHFFPEIDQEAAQRMAYPERCAYIAGRLCEVYRRKEAVIEEKVAAYLSCALADTPYAGGVGLFGCFRTGLRRALQ